MMKPYERWQEQIEKVMTEEPLSPELIDFHPERIILAKGAKDRPHRRKYIQRLAEAYPHAKVIEALDTPHNRISITANSDAGRRRQGKRTLVLGTIGRAVNQNNDKEMKNGIKCTHYWHFNSTYYCYYDCAFCYLSGNKGVSVSPTVRLFLNVEDI